MSACSDLSVGSIYQSRGEMVCRDLGVVGKERLTFFANGYMMRRVTFSIGRAMWCSRVAVGGSGGSVVGVGVLEGVERTARVF